MEQFDLFKKSSNSAAYISFENALVPIPQNSPLILPSALAAARLVPDAIATACYTEQSGKFDWASTLYTVKTTAGPLFYLRSAAGQIRYIDVDVVVACGFNAPAATEVDNVNKIPFSSVGPDIRCLGSVYSGTFDVQHKAVLQGDGAAKAAVVMEPSKFISGVPPVLTHPGPGPRPPLPGPPHPNPDPSPEQPRPHPPKPNPKPENPTPKPSKEFSFHPLLLWGLPVLGAVAIGTAIYLYNRKKKQQ